MSKKRGKKPNPTTSKGASMTDSAGRVTYGAGYEGDERATGSEATDAAQGLAANAVDTAQNAASATAGAVGAAVDTAQDAVSATAGAVGQVAGTVVDTAQDAVSATADVVADVAGAVVDTAQQATSTVTNAVSGTVGQVSDAAAGKVEQLADTVIETAYSTDVSEGTRAVAETTVSVLDRTAEYLRNGDLSVIVEDLRGAVRHHPLRSLVLGLGLGYLARSAFFPAAPKPTSASGPRGGAPSYPTSQSVPVYSGANYDTMSSTGYDTGRDVGYDAYTGTADIDTMTTIPLTDDVLAVDTIGVSDELTDLDTIGMSSGQGSLSSDTLGMGDDLTSLNTAGMRSDTSDAFSSGTATDLMDVDTSGGTLATDIGTTGTGLGSDISATTAPSADVSDELGVDAIDLGINDQPGTSGDITGSSASSTMPSDDLLRQWDSNSSGTGNSGTSNS